MKIGESIMIYSDPHREKIPIGYAELIEFIEDCETCEFWKVRFSGNGYIENVLIKKDEQK